MISLSFLRVYEISHGCTVPGCLARPEILARSMNTKNAVSRVCLGVQTRSYATAPIDAVKRIQYRPKNRGYGPRKAHLFSQYTNLLQANQVLLLVRYDNVKVQTLDKIRREVALLAAKSTPAPTLSSPTPTPTTSFSSAPSVAVTFIRPGVFTSSLRTKFDEATVQRAIKTLRGSYALITAQSLNPPQLAQLVRIIDKSVPPVRKDSPAPPTSRPTNPDDLEDAPPKVKLPPSITLVAGIVEDRFFLVDEVVSVSKLPTLETLRAQIVGLLSAPASNLAGVLGAAAGGSLMRTLQGFEMGLKEGEEKKEESL